MPSLPDVPLPPTEWEMAARRRSFIRLMIFFAFVFGCVFAFQAWRMYELRQSTIGDGQNVESYGFDLSNLKVEREKLVSARLPKDGRMVLNKPSVVSIEEADAHNEKLRTQGRWGRIIVNSDVVIGVAVGGEARAYPLRYVQWHEILNDTLGTTPIAVTYNPLCASAVVFDRRVGDETLEFGFSGLLYNSNLVMYDKRPESKGESLWCQLTMGPIAGPAATAGKQLTVLPLYIGQFGKWRELHPKTSVFQGELAMKDNYKRQDVYDSYYRKAEPMFSVSPAVPVDAAFKPFDTVMATLQADGSWALRAYKPNEQTDAPTDQPNVLSLYFAWHAIREAK